MAGMHSIEFETAEHKWWDWASARRAYFTIPDFTSNSTKADFFNNLVKRSSVAVVEMETPSSAEGVVRTTQEFLFMVGGMPRATRAQMVKPVMFMDQPCKPRKPAKVKIDPKPAERTRVLSQSSKLKISELQTVKDCLKGADYLREVQELEQWKLHAEHDLKYRTKLARLRELSRDQNVKAVREKYREAEKSRMMGRGR